VDNTAGTINVSRGFAIAAAVCAVVFLTTLVAGSLAGESDYGGSAGWILIGLPVFLTPVFAVFSIVSGMIQIGMRKMVIEQVGKWWALAVTSLAAVALAIFQLA
jgi:hypothetical protein